jgi:hypothetical protein
LVSATTRIGWPSLPGQFQCGWSASTGASSIHCARCWWKASLGKPQMSMIPKKLDVDGHSNGVGSP